MNQLSNYIPDLSQHCVDLRKLLSKDSAWIWTPAHRVCFDKIKAILAEPMGLKPFNADWKTELFIDFSPIGLGLALTQYDPNDSTKRQLIWCHSMSLSDAQSRYYAIEGEGLGLVWALQLCDYWLKGCPHFTVVTDHNPLFSLFKYKEYNALSPTMFN